MSSPRHFLTRPIRAAFVVALFACFCVQMYILGAKYTSGDTTMVSSRIQDPELKLPDLILCPSPGYKQDVLDALSSDKGRVKNPWQSIVFRTENITEDVWLRPPRDNDKAEEWFQRSTFGRLELLPPVVYFYDGEHRNVSVRELRSFHHGRCYRLSVPRADPVRAYLYVHLNMSSFAAQRMEEVLLYVGDAHGRAEVGVRFDFWTGRYTLVRLRQGVVAKISLEKAVEEYIPSKIGCNKFPLPRRDGGLYQTWLDCNVDETENSDVWKEALADHCYWPIMNDLKVRSATPCTMVGQGAKAFRVLRTSFKDGDRSCAECTREAYTLSIQSRNVQDDDDDVGAFTAFGLFFSDPLNDYSKQYVMHDFNSVLNGVGGSMGLFLGTSFLGILDFAVHNCQRLLAKRKQRRKKVIQHT